MNNFFNYDSSTGQVTLNVPEILLINEFKKLTEKNRNKCKEDKTGKDLIRAFKEFTYIYLCLHWRSPYADYYEQDRHEAALKDSGLTEEEFNDPDFRAACRKFNELQDSNRSIRLLKAAQNTIDKFVDYFDNVDVEERGADGKPIYKVKEIMGELSNLHKVNEELQILQQQVQKEISETSQIRANAEDGFLPDF